MVVKECIFFDKVLKKKVPCLLVPGEFYECNADTDKRFCVNVTFDDTKFASYNTNIDELYKYSSEMVYINDLYPARNQAELDYADLCMPKYYPKAYVPPMETGTTHRSDELDRYESLIAMITDVVGEIDDETFLRLFEFINYELHCWHCDTDEKAFVVSLSTSQMVSQPDPVEVPQMVRMFRSLFDNYKDPYPFKNYNISNYRNFTEFDAGLPRVVSIVNVDYNVNYITGV